MNETTPRFGGSPATTVEDLVAAYRAFGREPADAAVSKVLETIADAIEAMGGSILFDPGNDEA